MAPVTKPENQCSIPETHMVERTDSYKLSWVPYVYHGTCSLAYIQHTYTYKNKYLKTLIIRNYQGGILLVIINLHITEKILFKITIMGNRTKEIKMCSIDSSQEQYWHGQRSILNEKRTYTAGIKQPWAQSLLLHIYTHIKLTHEAA